MDQKTIDLLFALIRSAITGKDMSKKERLLFSEDMLLNLFNLSNKHDLSHVVYYALIANELISVDCFKLEGSYAQKFHKAQLLAVYRYQQIRVELKSICDSFERKQIPFVPLKGSVIRDFYREPWMRTSCDIDILIYENDLEKAVSFLSDECGYKIQNKGSHDVSLYSPSGQHLELHYNLIESGIANKSNMLLDKVWQNVVLKSNCKYHYEMTEAFFYFYHIAHMAKHFENGGCGIRPFIDMWILDQIDNDKKTCNDLLSYAQLLKFTSCCRKLNSVWFGDSTHDNITVQLQNYILFGGMYGSDKNRVIVQQQKRGGKLRYAISKIFIPYDVLKFHYPILQKHRWLTPIMEVRRWGKLIFCGYFKYSINELRYNKNINNSDAENTANFLNDIGLLFEE